MTNYENWTIQRMNGLIIRRRRKVLQLQAELSGLELIRAGKLIEERERLKKHSLRETILKANVCRKAGLTWGKIASILGISFERLAQYRNEALRDAQSLQSTPPTTLTLESSVTDMRLSVHAWNCLNNGNIATIRQLTEQTEASLLRIRTLGRMTLAEISAALNRHGFKLKGQ